MTIKMVHSDSYKFININFFVSILQWYVSTLTYVRKVINFRFIEEKNNNVNR